MHKLIIVTGQTATGKTKLAVELAQERSGEIVNADSRQVYKKLDIITGKDLKELDEAGIKHHMFDVADPMIGYSSHEYVTGARAAIKDIASRNMTPVIVGGSYLYIKHLLYGFDVRVPPDHQLRDELNTKTIEELQESIGTRPEDINDSDWANPHRLIRRIEISRSSHKVPSLVEKGIIDQFELTLIGLKHKDRESLEMAITKRVQKRLEEGALDEVKNLMKEGYKETDPGMKTIGYQQMMKFINMEYIEEQAIKVWTTREIQYAKRQMTFMKTDKNITWTTV